MAKIGSGTRKFNGETYHPQQYYTQRSNAKTHADELRKRGYKCRIVKVKLGGYMVYFRARR